jgi:hypothetical protein
VVAQKFLALSKAYSASTNEPSFAGLWWLAMWLNVLMVVASNFKEVLMRLV